MTLPFPPGEAWQVIQGYDQAGGSHKGYASFCWDFIVADQSQGGTHPAGSNSAPFYAAAPGQVVTVTENGVSGTSNPSNIVEIKQASSEIAGYLHLKQNSADVNINDNVARGQRLALTGDTGVGVGAYHLHFAVTDMPDGTPGFVTFPVAFSNYEIRDATGNWRRVFRGIPKNGEVIRAAPTPLPTGAAAQGDDMQPGEVLNPGQGISSANGRYHFIYQGDGNLVLYDGSRPLWASGTHGRPAGVSIMQSDGNLVTYAPGGQPICSSDTWQHPGSRLLVQDDGNVVIYHPDGTPVWATNTVQP
jgi:hypothetical protein